MTRNPTAADPPLVAGAAAGGAVAEVCAQAIPNVITVHPLEGPRQAATPVPQESSAYRLLESSRTMRVGIEGLGEDRALRTLVSGKAAASPVPLHAPAPPPRAHCSN